MTRPRSKGIILITVLFMVVVLTMYTSALLKLSLSDLSNDRHVVEKARAREACRAGLNHIIHLLTYAPSSQNTVSRQWENCAYRIDFSPSAPFHSVNNLVSLSLSTTPNLEGKPVGPNLADVVVQGSSGGARCHLRAILSSGLLLSKSAGSDGPLSITSDSEVGGIRSLIDPTPTGGGLFSRYVSTSPSVPSISVPNAGITFSSTSSVVAPAPRGGVDVTGAVPSDQIRQQSNDAVPDLDVSRLVSDQSSLPAPAGLLTVPGGYELNSPSLTQPTYINGNLVVRGDVHLNAGSLYVKGNVTILGGVAGEGSIFSDGDVKILGGTTSLRTNQRSGAAVFANGDVTLQGLNANGYLDSLANTYPAVRTAVDTMRTKVAAAQAVMQDSSQDSFARFYQGLDLGGGVSVTPSQAQGIAGPDGSRAIADGGVLLDTAAQIKLALGPSFANDSKAQKIVSGLEQYSYDLRGANHTTRDSVSSTYTPLSGGLFNDAFGWDDNALLPTADPGIAGWSQARVNDQGPLVRSLSLDHQYRVIYGTAQAEAPAYALGLANNYSQQLTAVARTHPTDFSWLGSSNLQGIVYAKGNLKIENEFNLYGTALSKGKIQVNNRSRLIYVEEYARTLGRTGPVHVLTRYEL
ncbi:hypothetical protein JST97_35765 [bacterium]|nr:hypothetical protein [bacterium]